MAAFTERMEMIFGTRVYQKIGAEGTKAQEILEKAVLMMRGFEEKLSFYSADSEVGLINAHAGERFTAVSEDTFEIIRAAKHYHQITKGCLDVTIAPLVAAWGIGSDHPRFLNADEIRNLLPLVNDADLLLDERRQSVLLAKSGQKIDLGGIAKGYIADAVINLYKAEGISHAIINIGGNIKVLGGKAESQPWSIGIYEPSKHSGKVLGALNLNDASVVTSGSYERAFIYEDKIYHHILNPKTGLPAVTDLKSMTVVSSSSLEADALSTPLFIMGKHKAYEFMKKYKLSGIMITDEDEIIITRNLIPCFSLLKGGENLKVRTF